MQKVLFPGTHMRITQDEYGSYSHKGSMARDDGGKDTVTDSPVLAPFDGTVARVRSNSSHETYIVSDGAVECANGYVGVVTFLFMHDNQNRVRAGQHVKQGDVIGYEGGFGGGVKDKFAHHTHREWAKGEHTTQSRNAQGTYCIGAQMHEYDVCFLRPDTMVWNGSNFAPASERSTDNCGHSFRVADAYKPFSDEPVEVTVSAAVPISSGDVALLGAWAAEHGVGSTQQDGAVVIGPLSAGDQISLQEYAAGLSLQCRADTGPATATVTGGPLNVRTRPGTSYPAITQVQAGEVYEVADQADGWYCLLLGDGCGWCSGDYLEV